MAPTHPIVSSQEWLEQSSLLLKAHPATTRISSKYSQKSSSKYKGKTAKAGPAVAGQAADSNAITPQPTQANATFKLKTYDPVSGVCLAYETDKAAEVGRLVAYLGSLGRNMCGLPEKDPDAVMVDAGIAQEDEGLATPNVTAKVPTTSSGQQQGGGGGGKKKKKGRK